MKYTRDVHTTNENKITQNFKIETTPYYSSRFSDEA